MKKQLLMSFAAAALLTACGTTESKMGMGTSLQDLPQAAQASVQKQIGNAQILDIDKERRTGREVYEITYQDSGGQKQKLHVAADGTILSQRQAGARGLMHEAAGAFRGDSSSTDTQQNQSGASAQFNADSSSSSSSSQGAGVSAQADLKSSSPSASATYQKDSANTSSSQSADFSAGAQNSRSSDLNSGASSSTSASGNYNSDSSRGTSSTSGSTDFSAGAQSSAPSASVETSTSSGKSVDYKANTDSADRIQTKRDVRGGAEGLLQKPSLDIQESSGAERSDANADLKSDSSSSSSSVDVSKDSAGAEKRTEATVDTDTEHAPSKMHVTFDALPAAVQTAVRQHGDEAQIQKISKKTKDGKTVYDVQFKGESDKLCISEDGTVMEKDK